MTHVPIGVYRGNILFLSESAISQGELRNCLEAFDLVRRFPVKTGLSVYTVMVEANSHEEAVQKYLSSLRNQTVSKEG